MLSKSTKENEESSQLLERVWSLFKASTTDWRTVFVSEEYSEMSVYWMKTERITLQLSVVVTGVPKACFSVPRGPGKVMAAHLFVAVSRMPRSK